MNKHTVSLELAKQMEKLGWEKETLFWWDKVGNVSKDYVWALQQKMRPRYVYRERVYPAPIASEILEELPAYITTYRTKLKRSKISHPIHVGKHNTGDSAEISLLGQVITDKEKIKKNIPYYSVWYAQPAQDIVTSSIADPSPAEALGKMWVYLKKEKLI